MEISKEILFARRRLEEIEEMDIIDDLKWNQEAHLWFILVKIHVEKTENASIQKDTKWYIVLQESYPSGNVEIYPAVKDGVRNTFNHQNNNGVVCKNGLWRNGKLCLNNPLDIIGVGNEPDTFEEKLYWNAKRAVEWVRAAASNRLINAGEYYEIPDFIVKKGYRILYNEDMVSMMEWEDSEENWGYVDFICAGNNQYYSDTYSSISGKICKTTKWGKYVVSFKERMEGAWILLKTEPVINGWQAPNIFDELKQALRKQGIDFKSILEKIMPHFRDGKRHILMIGFPIPKKIGQEANLIHWESFLLPILSFGKRTANGFRCNEAGWRMRDFQEVILNEGEIEWLITENWNSNEILNRGKFKQSITKRRILLIGAGTLGANIGEQLIRGGAYKLTVIDDDIYTIGNSARHILSIDSVGKNKANELARHYNSINPNLSIEALDDKFTKENVGITEEYDVILDCSASNDVLKLLSEYKTKHEKQYILVSFGYKAEILYFVYQRARQFDLNKYVAEFGAVMKKNVENIMDDELPWEGTGCWSPVFPAMAADVQLVASFATGILRNIMENDVSEDQYFIYKRINDDNGVIKGFVRV